MNWLYGAYLFLLGLELFEDGADVQGGDLHHFVAGVLGFENEVGLADLAIFHAPFGAGTLPGVLEFIHAVTHEGNQADPLTEEFVVQNAGIFDDGDEMRGEGGYFGDHDASQCVGKADVAAGECELDAFSAEFKDLNGNPVHN